MIKSQRLLIPLLVGLVTLPRLSIDLYLPSLTYLGIFFNSGDASLQMTLSAFMLGSASCMLIAGPLSDVIGCKRVVVYGLSIFILASLMSIEVSSISTLIVCRYFQALGGSCGTLIARLMVKESFQQTEQIKILSYLSSAMAICPLFIPFSGGVLQYYFGWQAIFIVLSIIGLSLLLICSFQLNEQFTNITKNSIKQLLINYHYLLRHRLFMAYSITIGCAWSNYFAFTASSPFLYQQLLGYNSIVYGILVALPVFGYLIGTVLTRTYANSVGWDQLIFFAALISLIGALLLIGLVLTFTLNWIIITIPIMIIMTGVGIIIPCTQGAVMQPFKHITGTASGLFYFIQMIFGAATGLILQSLSHHSALPLATLILISTIILIFSFTLLIPVRSYEVAK